MTINQKFQKLLSREKLEKVTQVSYNLRINPNWLLAVMYFESARTFNPAITNGIGSVGLIQFTRDKKGVGYKTIGGKQYLLSDIKQMSFIEQMNLVEKYYKDVISFTKKTPQSFIDTYLITFFPNAIGKTNDYVFETKGLTKSLIAKQNPAFDKNKDGKIVKYEVLSYFQSLYKQLGFDFDKDINQSKAGGFFLP
jgi:hypothetical protein